MALATDADAISVRRAGNLIFAPSTSRSSMRINTMIIWQVTNTKLAGDWSGGRFLQSFHNVDDFARVVSVFPKLEPLVKVRLLLACALAPSSDRGKHHAELQRLADQAAADEDEWVRIMSTTASGFSGALNWDAVLDKFPLVSLTHCSRAHYTCNAACCLLLWCCTRNTAAHQPYAQTCCQQTAQLMQDWFRRWQAA